MQDAEPAANLAGLPGLHEGIILICGHRLTALHAADRIPFVFWIATGICEHFFHMLLIFVNLYV